MTPHSNHEMDNAGTAVDEFENDAPDAELEDLGGSFEDGMDANGERMDDDDADTADVSRGASRRASAAVLNEWENDSADEDGESGEHGEAVEGLTLRERRMAAQLAETRRQMAEMRYRLYETAVERVLAGWDRQTFQFSVIESRVKDPRGGITSGGATARRQGMVGLSRAAREAIREVMLSETVFRLSEDEREQIWRAFELALAGAVDLSARGGSFDQEERKTIRRGGPALSGSATEAALQEAAETLALSEYGKPLSRLTHEELVQVQLHAAEQTSYR